MNSNYLTFFSNFGSLRVEKGVFDHTIELWSIIVSFFSKTTWYKQLGKIIQFWRGTEIWTNYSTFRGGGGGGGGDKQKFGQTTQLQIWIRLGQDLDLDLPDLGQDLHKIAASKMCYDLSSDQDWYLHWLLDFPSTDIDLALTRGREQKSKSFS